eukprot:4177955-Prymnesium_polylepis.2
MGARWGRGRYRWHAQPDGMADPSLTARPCSRASALGTDENAEAYVGATVVDGSIQLSESQALVPVIPTYSVPSLLGLHAVLMMIAWLLLAPFGVVVARFGKPSGVAKGGGGGVAPWFVYHRATQVAAAFLTVIGAALGIAETDTTFGDHLFSSHATLGIAVLALVLVQPLNAVMRPAKDAASHLAWSATHKLVGYSACVCALVNCILGSDEIGKLFRIAHGIDDSTGDTLR